MTIVITLPHFFDGEAGQIVQLLQSSVELVHIRKPDSKAEDVERLIRSIPPAYRGRLVLHDHHGLAAKYQLHGVHLNSRNPQPPEDWKGSVSKSCHSLQEVREWRDKCDYLSLSPIFDSISKRGYHAAFTREQIEEARREGIIDQKVLALGGVTFDKIDEVLRMGFGGGMILGDAWKNNAHEQQAVALTIAGSDPSAGAGIQQDLKTLSAIGVYGATVITAITSQNTMGVKSVMAVPAEVVRSQLDAVLSDLRVEAVKIGMVPNAAIAHTVATTLSDYKKTHPLCSIVYDPIMVSTSGHLLMEADCIDRVCRELLPLCTLVTPNLPETQCLLAHAAQHSQSSLFSHSPESSHSLQAPQALVQAYKTHFLVKGGHAEGEELADVLYLTTGEICRFPTQKIHTHNLHGTGCTLSSAIAAYLLRGNDLSTAIKRAKGILEKGIRQGAVAHIGKGNGPLILT